jgi:hypothetical protein
VLDLQQRSKIELSVFGEIQNLIEKIWQKFALLDSRMVEKGPPNHR